MSASSVRETRSSSRLSKPIDTTKGPSEDSGPTRRSTRRLSQSDDSVGSAAPSTRRSSSRLSQISEAESMESLSNITTRKYSTRSKKSADDETVHDAVSSAGRRSNSRLNQISESTESLQIPERGVTKSSSTRAGRRSNSRLSQISESSETLSIIDKGDSNTLASLLPSKIDESRKGDDSGSNSRSEENARRSIRLTKVATPDKKNLKPDVVQSDDSSTSKDKAVEKLKESRRLSSRINKVPTLEDIEEAPNENVAPIRRSTRLRRESETSDTDEKTTPVKTRGRKSTLFITLDKIPDEEEEESKVPTADGKGASPKIVDSSPSVAPRRGSLRSKNDNPSQISPIESRVKDRKSANLKSESEDNKIYNVIHSEIKRMSSSESLDDLEDEQAKDSLNKSNNERKSKDFKPASKNGPEETEEVDTCSIQSQKFSKIENRTSLSSQKSPSDYEQLKLMKCVVDLVDMGEHSKKSQSPKSVLSPKSSPLKSVVDLVDKEEDSKKSQSPKSVLSPKSSPLKTPRRSSILNSSLVVKSADFVETCDKVSNPLSFPSASVSAMSEITQDVKSPIAQSAMTDCKESSSVESSPSKKFKTDQGIGALKDSPRPLSLTNLSISKISSPSPVKNVGSPRKSGGKITSPKSRRISEEGCILSMEETEALQDEISEGISKVNPSHNDADNIIDSSSLTNQRKSVSHKENTNVCDSSPKIKTSIEPEEEEKSDSTSVNSESDEIEASVNARTSEEKTFKRLSGKLSAKSNSPSSGQSLANKSPDNRKNDETGAKTDHKIEDLNRSKSDEGATTNNDDNVVIPLDESDSDEPELITLKYSDDENSDGSDSDINEVNSTTCDKAAETDTMKTEGTNKSTKPSGKFHQVEEITSELAEASEIVDSKGHEEDEIDDEVTSDVIISDSSESEENDTSSKVGKRSILGSESTRTTNLSRPSVESKARTEEYSDENSDEDASKDDAGSSDEENSSSGKDSMKGDPKNKAVSFEAEDRSKTKLSKGTGLEKLNDVEYVCKIHSYINDVLESRQKLKQISKFSNHQDKKLKSKKVAKPNALSKDKLISNVLKTADLSTKNKNIEQTNKKEQATKNSGKLNDNRKEEKTASSALKKPLKSALKNSKNSSETAAMSENKNPSAIGTKPILSSKSIEDPDSGLPPAKKQKIFSDASDSESDKVPTLELLPAQRKKTLFEPSVGQSEKGCNLDLSTAKKKKIFNKISESEMAVKNSSVESKTSVSQKLKQQLPSAEIMNERKENCTVFSTSVSDGSSSFPVLPKSKKKSKKSKKSHALKEKGDNQCNVLHENQQKLLNKVAKEKGFIVTNIGNPSIQNVQKSVIASKAKLSKNTPKHDKTGVVSTSWGKVLIESQPQNPVVPSSKKLTDSVNKWEIKPNNLSSSSTNLSNVSSGFKTKDSSLKSVKNSRLPKATPFTDKISPVGVQVAESGLPSSKKKKKKKKKVGIEENVTSSDIMKSLLNRFLEKSKVSDPSKRLPSDKTESTSVNIPHDGKGFDSEVEESFDIGSKNFPAQKKINVVEPIKQRKLNFQDVFSKNTKVDSNSKKVSAVEDCPTMNLAEKEKLIQNELERKRKFLEELEKRTPTPIKKFKADKLKKFASSGSSVTPSDATAKSLPLHILEKLSDTPQCNSGGFNQPGELKKKKKKKRKNKNKNNFQTSVTDMSKAECLRDDFIPLSSSGPTKFKVAVVDKLSSRTPSDSHFKNKNLQRKNLIREPTQNVIKYRQKMKNLSKDGIRLSSTE